MKPPQPFDYEDFCLADDLERLRDNREPEDRDEDDKCA
jgi:hypothetical protein